MVVRSSALFLVFLAMSMSGSLAYAVQKSEAQKNGGHGELTVTLTVVASVGIVFGPDGEQKVVVANAPDLQREFESMFSRPRYTRLTPVIEHPRARLVHQRNKLKR